MPRLLSSFAESLRCALAFGKGGRMKLGRWWLGLLLPVLAMGASGPIREYDLKAVFLYNFVTFVEWPAGAMPNEGEEFSIGILGKDPFGRVLDEVINGESMRGHPLRVRRCHSVDEARACQIVFISTSETERLTEIFRALRDEPVLTVGESAQFATQGGMIGFTTGTRVGLEVNIDQVQRAKLQISSKLLHVARIVSETRQP